MTTDSKAFYYVSQAVWDGWLADSRTDGRKKINAQQYLRKFDAAGRIMETDEGIAAPTPCARCTRGGLGKVCRIFKNRKDKACAYCKRLSKAGCAAAVAPETEPGPENELEGRPEKAETVIDEQGKLIKKHGELLEQQAAQLQALQVLLPQIRSLSQGSPEQVALNNGPTASTPCRQSPSPSPQPDPQPQWQHHQQQHASRISLHQLHEKIIQQWADQQRQ